MSQICCRFPTIENIQLQKWGLSSWSFCSRSDVIWTTLMHRALIKTFFLNYLLYSWNEYWSPLLLNFPAASGLLLHPAGLLKVQSCCCGAVKSITLSFTWHAFKKESSWFSFHVTSFLLWNNRNSEDLFQFLWISCCCDLKLWLSAVAFVHTSEEPFACNLIMYCWTLWTCASVSGIVADIKKGLVLHFSSPSLMRNLTTSIIVHEHWIHL